MKKVLLVVCVAAFALTSCKKDYKCDCTIAGTTTSTTYSKLSKKEAKDVEATCNNASNAAKIFGGSCTWGTK